MEGGDYVPYRRPIPYLFFFKKDIMHDFFTFSSTAICSLKFLLNVKFIQLLGGGGMEGFTVYPPNPPKKHACRRTITSVTSTRK